MALDRQIDFTGGLNTRIPAHKLSDNMVQAATNVDFSHGDVRPDRGIGGDGGGKQFYYEKGLSWVGTDEPNAFTILVVDAGTTPDPVTIPSTNLGNPLIIQETGTYQIGMTDTVTASSNILTTAGGAHGLVVNDTIVLAGSDVPLPLVAGTTYFIKTVPDVDEMTLCLTEGSTVITLADAGSGTITLTSVTSLVVNDTELNLGSVTSFVEYNDDLYMGRDSFQVVATTVYTGSEVLLTAADIAKVIVSDSFVGTGIEIDASVESIDTGTNKVTLDRDNTVGSNTSNVTLTVHPSPARIMDGILNKIYPIEIPVPEPHDITVSQLSGSNPDRAMGHSVKYLTDNFPIPLQWGIARFDDSSGAEGGISVLSSMFLSQANINSDSTHTSIPAVVKFRINKQDVNSEGYGKFALYRVGGTSSVIKKVQDVYITSQSDGSPLSVVVSGSTINPLITVGGLPTGAEWKVKWFGYGAATASHRKYHSGGITSIAITGTVTGYDSGAPSVTIAAPTGTGGKTATAKAVLTGDSLTNIIITEKGSGYTSAPTVTIAAGDGTPTGTAAVEALAPQGETTLFNTNRAINLYGSNTAHAVDLHFIVKFTSEDVSPVSGAPYSDDTREYLFASTNIIGTALTGDSGSASHVGCGSFIDFTPPRALIEIEPISDPTTVPYGLKHLTEFNNFFMGSVDTRLHISNYAKPNNFAIDGYLDFDGQITGVASRGGEAVVFTERGVYRVYGNAHNEMRKVQVPTVHGVPVGGHKSISKIGDSIVYASHSGLCLFNGRDVTVLTDALIQDFTTPSANPLDNVSGVVDNVYYLLTSGEDGWKLDMRQSPKLCRSTNRASNFHHRSMNNRLYSEAGYIGGATTDNKYSFETKDFTGGNITAEKAYYTVYVTGSDFSGTINIKCDGTLANTFTFNTAIAEFNRALYLTTATVANRASIEFINCSGKITTVSIKYDVLAEQQKKRFNSVTFTYTGTPSVTVKVDSIEKIASIALADPGSGNTGTSILYFPAMTEGHIPHIVADETETSRISGSVFDTEAI